MAAAQYLAEYGGRLAAWWHGMSSLDLAWFSVGLTGQLLFVLRWFLQWLASERAGRLVVPDIFWYASFVGGTMIMAYGLYKPEPLLVLGQFGVLLYARNIYFIWRQRALAAGLPAKRRSPLSAEGERVARKKRF